MYYTLMRESVDSCVCVCVCVCVRDDAVFSDRNGTSVTTDVLMVLFIF